MIFTFQQSLSTGFNAAVPVLSGQKSLQFSGSEYLIVKDEGNQRAFEIKYEFHCSSFKQAAIEDNLLLVGHEGQFYLYDLERKQQVLSLEMDGYFGHFYVHKSHFYVADSSSLFCLNKLGNIIWRNTHLGIDGVIVETITDNNIYVSGEWDPPGGWEDFILDIKTGEKI